MYVGAVPFGHTKQNNTRQDNTKRPVASAKQDLPDISRISCQKGPICHADRALLAGYHRYLGPEMNVAKYPLHIYPFITEYPIAPSCRCSQGMISRALHRINNWVLEVNLRKLDLNLSSFTLWLYGQTNILRPRQNGRHFTQCFNII